MKQKATLIIDGKEIEGLKTETSENYPHKEMIKKGIVLGILKELD